MPNAISLKFYDGNDECIATHEKSFLPYGLLKKAIILGKQTEGKHEEEVFDNIADYVVEMFGNKFTREELEKCADVNDVFSVFYEVVNRAKLIGLQKGNFPKGK